MGTLNLLGSVTGKASIWIIGILVAISMSLALWVYLLKADIKVERSERSKAENSVVLQNALIESNRAEYEANLQSVKEQKQKVKVEYKTKTQIIEKWRENNATCSDAMLYLNSYNF